MKKSYALGNLKKFSYEKCPFLLLGWYITGRNVIMITPECYISHQIQFLLATLCTAVENPMCLSHIGHLHGLPLYCRKPLTAHAVVFLLNYWVLKFQNQASKYSSLDYTYFINELFAVLLAPLALMFICCRCTAVVNYLFLIF